MGFDSQLRQLSYNGGIPSTFFRSWTSASIRSVQNGLGTRGYRNEFTGKLVSGDVDFPQQELDANITDIYEQVMQHPLDDGFYDNRSAVWENIEVPFLSFSSWAAVGVHLRGNVEGFVNAASSKKWLSIRQEHGVFSALYSKEGVELQRRFFDYVLKDIKEFAEQQPKVELVIRDTNDQKIGMRSETEWPLACTEWTKLYLDADTTALLGDAPASSSSVTYRAFSKGITFLTKPFGDNVEITGPLAAKLWVSTSTTDADIFVAVRIFDQDGKEKLFHGLPDPRMPFTQGWLRASQRELDPDRSLPYRPFLSHNTVKPLWPGKAYEVDIEIWPTCAVIPAGYRLGLSILGQDFEHDEQPTKYGKFGQMMRGSGTWVHDDPIYRPPAVFDNEITLHSGPDQHAYLLLPVITKPLDMLL